MAYFSHWMREKVTKMILETATKLPCANVQAFPLVHRPACQERAPTMLHPIRPSDKNYFWSRFFEKKAIQ